jgi:hypothetical protein
MRRIAFLASLAVAAASGAVFAQAGSAAASPEASAPAKAYSSDRTPIGTLLADPAAKAVLEKYIPSVVDSPQIGRASGYTLKFIKPFSHGQITDADLAGIDADLAKLPTAASD